MGCFTPATTTKHTIPLENDNIVTRKVARKRCPWLAQECLHLHPKLFSKQKDMYSIGFVVSQISKVIQIPPININSTFFKHIYITCKKAMEEEAKDTTLRGSR